MMCRIKESCKWNKAVFDKYTALIGDKIDMSNGKLCRAEIIVITSPN
jgi:hypothetical protein